MYCEMFQTKPKWQQYIIYVSLKSKGIAAEISEHKDLVCMNHLLNTLYVVYTLIREVITDPTEVLHSILLVFFKLMKQNAVFNDGECISAFYC